MVSVTTLENIQRSARAYRNMASSVNFDLHTWYHSIQPALEAYQSFSFDYSRGLDNLRASLTYSQEVIANSVTTLNLAIGENYRHLFSLSSEVSNFYEISRMATTHLSSVLTDLTFDFTGVEQLNLETISESSLQGGLEGNADLNGTLTVRRPQKTLADMTEEEFEDIIKRSVVESQNGKKVSRTFSIVTFLGVVFQEYVVDTARVIIEIVFAFMITFAAGQFNQEVRAEIVDRMDESLLARDARKIITRYVKVNPYGQMGFLKVETYLREGTSKNASVVSATKVNHNTVLTILDRKNNWFKVEVETDNDCFIGWVQESKVIKFKRVD